MYNKIVLGFAWSLELKLFSLSMDSLQKQISKWHSSHQFPIVALVQINDELFSTGSPGFSNFHKIPTIKQAFDDVIGKAAAHEQKELEKVLPTEVEDFSTCKRYSRDEFRHYLTAIVTARGSKKAKWGDLASKPIWWPDEVSWRDPNNHKPQMNKKQMALCLNRYRSFVSVEANEECRSKRVAIELEEGEEEEEEGEEEAGQYFVRKQEIEEEVMDTEEDRNEDDDMEENMPGHPSLPGGCLNDPLLDVSLLVKASDFVMNPKLDNDTEFHRTNTLRHIKSLEFCDLRVVDNLLDLLFMSITLDLFERACFLIWGSWHANKHLLSSDETVNNVGHVDIWRRSVIPQQLLEASFEPIRVTSDGNSLYEAVSLSLHGTTKHTSAIKLFSIAGMVVNKSKFLHDLHQTCDSNLWIPKAFREFNEKDLLSQSRKMCHVSPETNILSLFAVGVLELCSLKLYVPKYDNHVVLIPGPHPIVNLLKMKSSHVGKSKEQFVPILQVNTDFNTFSESSTRRCGALEHCAYGTNKAPEASWRQCKSCLIHFHLNCLTFYSKLPNCWNCGCTLNVLLFNHLSLQTLTNSRRLTSILKQETGHIKGLLEKLQKKKIASRHVGSHETIGTKDVKDTIKPVLRLVTELFPGSDKFAASYLVALAREVLVFLTVKHVLTNEATRFKVEELLESLGYL